MCPVLHVDAPANQEWLSWFDRTHRVVQGEVRRIEWPFAGAMADQSAKLVDAFELIANVLGADHHAVSEAAAVRSALGAPDAELTH